MPAEPEMPAWAGTVWQCWESLHHDRVQIPVGMGASVPGRIPWLAVDAWARRYGISGDQFEFLLICLEAMDLEYMVHQQRLRTDGNPTH